MPSSVLCIGCPLTVGVVVAGYEVNATLLGRAAEGIEATIAELRAVGLGAGVPRQEAGRFSVV